jgi:hypothetical protein
VVHLNDLYRRFEGRATFAFVGIEEAGHGPPGFEGLHEDCGVSGDEHWFEGRRRRVGRAQEKARLCLPGYLDGPDGAASRAYAAWPARLVVVGVDGNLLRDFGPVVWKGWHWDEVARVLEKECDRAPAGQVKATNSPRSAPAPSARPGRTRGLTAPRRRSGAGPSTFRADDLGEEQGDGEDAHQHE